MGCSDDKSTKIINEETNPDMEDEDSTKEKEFTDFEELKSNQLYVLFHIFII